MADTITVKFKVMEDGSLKAIGKDADKAAAALDKTSKSARTADRNIKGAAQASANGTKNFSKMAQGMGGLVGAYATFAASVFALSAAFNFLKNAADVALLEQSQVQFAQNSGIAMESLTNKLRAASKGMLDFQSAAAASAMGLAKGFSSEQMDEMAEGALKVSNVLGRNFTDSFDRLTRGVSKAEPELLDELGITLKLETAKRKYAESLGISADALSSADASQAVYLETMEQLNKVVGDAEGQANPFMQLAATFNDLAKTLSGFILPPFEALAGFLNKNAAVAALFFGAIGMGIIKNMPFVAEAKEAISSFFDSQEQKADEAKSAMAAYAEEIKKTKQAAASLREEGGAEVKSGASKAVEAGSTSKVLARAASGEMKGADKSNLKKALKSAEKQYKEHGKITKGIFKDVGIDIAREIGNGLKKTETQTRSTGQKINGFFKRIQLRSKVVGTALKRGLAGGFKAVGRAATMAGKAMNMAMKGTVILGIIQMIYDMIMAVVNAPRTMLDGIIKGIKFALKMIQGMANMAISLVNYLKEQLNKIPGVKLEMSEDFTFGDDLGKKIEEGIKNSSIYKAADAHQTAREEALGYKDSLEQIRNTAKDLGKELDTITKGKVFDKDAVNSAGEKTYDPLKADRAKANTMQSLPVLDMMRELDELLPRLEKNELGEMIPKGDAELYSQGLKKIGLEMQGLEKISPAFHKAVISGNTAAVQEMTENAGKFNRNIEEAHNQLGNMSSALKGASSEAVLSYVTNIEKLGTSAEDAGKSLGLTSDVQKKIDERFKAAGGVDQYIENLRAVEAEEKRIANEKSVNAIAKVDAGANLNSAFGQREQLEIAHKEAILALDEKHAALAKLKNEDVLIMDQVQQEIHQKAMEQGQREIDLAEAKMNAAKKAADEMAQMGLKIGDSLQSNMESAFNSLIDGTKSAKEAFADMAKAILADIAKMITKMLVMKMLESALGGTSFGNFLGIDGGRNGGVFEQGKKQNSYRSGGVAKGSQGGYPAMLHGTEAVVPLPNGRSIPVEMKNTGGNVSNVTVNVSTEAGNTSAQTEQNDGGMDQERLGKAIAVAVQNELQNQKRSGGILNPYGVA